ncbi:MAG: M23 family metallopeptidase [Paracoccaceae bacterium]
MIAIVLGLQVALPLALLLWFALAPLGSTLGFALQAAGIAAFLFALARVAQWALPVWWLPRVYAGLWLAIMGMHLFRAHLGGLPNWPSGPWGWAGTGFALVLLGLGGWTGGRALGGRMLPPGQIVDIANPFGPGTYLVGHGGSNTLVNGHMRTLDPAIERFRPWRGQSYAVDFFGLGPWGLRASGWQPADPEAYAIFGASLRAPCAGTISRAEGHWPDYEVPESDQVNRLGNHVILRCGDAEIVFAHMRQGSVAVEPGDRVKVGDMLGEVGNSGASTEPHLHIHAQRPAPEDAPPISGEPLGLRIDGRFLVRGDRLDGPDG